MLKLCYPRLFNVSENFKHNLLLNLLGAMLYLGGVPYFIIETTTT